ncbi:hypothetical protein [Chitinophaga sp. CF118]|nr:hypothetical protein [Chitinophaga sp. CF118]
MERYKHLKGEFSGCAIRGRNNVAFFGQQWTNDDPLEICPTGT